MGVLLIDEGTRPVEPPATWGIAAPILLIIAFLLAVVLILRALRRKQIVRGP